MISIIGSGLAGYTLAREIRKINQQIPLQIISADDAVYYSKPQLSSAFTHKKTADQLAMMSVNKFSQQLNTEIFPHTQINFLDAEKKFFGNEEKSFSYDKLILAQGAAPIKINIAGDAADTVTSINNLQDYRFFREKIAAKKHITLLGAGLVGCEFANDLINGGYQVSVIALAETPMELLLPPALGKVLQNCLTQHGVTWYLQNSLQSVDHHGEQLQLSLADGQKIITDHVISAIGLRPVTDLAQSAGLTVNNGIVVDRYLQTSNKNIYALGDCANVSGLLLYFIAPLATAARALAHTLTDTLTPVVYPPLPVVVKTPSCPLVVCPPLKGIEGEWQISGKDVNQKALFYDNNGLLKGFVLIGSCVEEKLSLAKEIPDWLNNHE